MADSARFNTPRIRRVLNPATGQYEVSVLADSNLEIRFPRKPFGLPIEELGLAPKDAKKYAEYILVGIESADNESKTHHWIFQKLSGPEWTTTSKSQDNLTPAKYRGQTVVVKTEQEVAPATLPTELAGDLVSSVVTQTPNSGKAVLTEVTETIDENAAALVGQQAYEQRQVVDVTEKLVVDGTPAQAGLLIVSDSVTPIGNGKSVEQTVSVTEWKELSEVEWNDDLNSHVTRTEKFVSPSELDTPSAHSSYKIVNEHRSLRITGVVPTDALRSVHLVSEAETEVRLPDTLLSVEIIVTRILSNGDSIGVGSSYSLSGTSSVAVSADLTYEIEEGYSGPATAEIHVFYLPADSVTKAAVLEACDAEPFPRFRAKSHRVVISGHGLSKHVEQSNHSNGMSLGESSSITALINAVALPNSLHGEIPINIVYNDLTDIPTGLASEYRDRITQKSQELLSLKMAALSSGQRLYGLDTSNPENSAAVLAILTSLSAQVELGVTLNVEDFPVVVSPAILPATSPSEVPTGRFLQSFRTNTYAHGYVQVSAVVVTL